MSGGGILGPNGMPPGMPPGGPVGLVVSTPLNDCQLIYLGAAELMASFEQWTPAEAAETAKALFVEVCAIAGNGLELRSLIDARKKQLAAEEEARQAQERQRREVGT